MGDTHRKLAGRVQDLTWKWTKDRKKVEDVLRADSNKADDGGTAYKSKDLGKRTEAQERY